MKRKILSLVFAAAMLLGTATMTKAMNSWECVTINDDCIGWVMICGEGETSHEVIISQEQMLEVWYDIYDC